MNKTTGIKATILFEEKKKKDALRRILGRTVLQRAPPNEVLPVSDVRNKRRRLGFLKTTWLSAAADKPAAA